MTSSTIDKKLEIYTKLEIELEINKNLEYELEIDKNLENFESIFEFFVNFESIFEFFVISSFLSMVDELTISKNVKLRVNQGKICNYLMIVPCAFHRKVLLQTQYHKYANKENIQSLQIWHNAKYSTKSRKTTKTSYNTKLK